MRSNILLSACAERNEAYLDGVRSSETGSRCALAARRRGARAPCTGILELGQAEGEKEMGAHFNRNCSESKIWLRVMASGFSATASTMGSSTPVMTPSSASDS